MLRIVSLVEGLRELKSQSQEQAMAASDRLRGKLEAMAVGILDKGIALTEKQLDALKTVRSRQG